MAKTRRPPKLSLENVVFGSWLAPHFTGGLYGGWGRDAARRKKLSAGFRRRLRRVRQVGAERWRDSRWARHAAPPNGERAVALQESSPSSASRHYCNHGIAVARVLELLITPLAR